LTWPDAASSISAGERIVRALEKAGFKAARVAGSHHIMRHADGGGTTVPVHQGRDVAKGTLRGILSDIGMSVEELRRLL
jgi:predicted RNA binding protein YcfA (HicA-like mRNA interferase family)